MDWTAETAPSKEFGSSLKLLSRWRSILYKLVWPDLAIFLGVYFSMNAFYRFALSREKQIFFEEIVRYCDKNGSAIPVSILLGLYVWAVAGRWWEQFKSIPSPDTIAICVSANIQCKDGRGIVIKRTIMRYCCLYLAMTLTLISSKVRKRFRSLDHFVKAGLLLENEKETIQEVNESETGYDKEWLPMIWACSIVTNARKDGKFSDDFAMRTILNELNKFRTACSSLRNHLQISVPPVYTQAVKLVVYSYLLAILIGGQRLLPDGTNKGKAKSLHHELNLIFAVLATIKFLFYTGWLKLAESLLNHEDDGDEFELESMIDRNLKASYLILEQMQTKLPKVPLKECWDEIYQKDYLHDVEPEQQCVGKSLFRSMQNINTIGDDEIDFMDMIGATDLKLRVPGTGSRSGGIIERRRKREIAGSPPVADSSWRPNRSSLGQDYCVPSAQQQLRAPDELIQRQCSSPNAESSTTAILKSFGVGL